jgi:hypothetical protein
MRRKEVKTTLSREQKETLGAANPQDGNSVFLQKKIVRCLPRIPLTGNPILCNCKYRIHQYDALSEPRNDRL